MSDKFMAAFIITCQPSDKRNCSPLSLIDTDLCLLSSLNLRPVYSRQLIVDGWVIQICLEWVHVESILGINL